MSLRKLFTPRRDEAREFFDWMIVRHASDKLQDDDATLALALCRLLNHELARLQRELDRYGNPGQDEEQVATPVVATPRQIRDHCGLLRSKIEDLKLQRGKLLYQDYRVREKAAAIFRKSMQLTID